MASDWKVAREAVNDLTVEVDIFEKAIQEKLRAVALYRWRATGGRDIDDAPIDPLEAADAVMARTIADVNAMYSRLRQVLMSQWVALQDEENK